MYKRQVCFINLANSEISAPAETQAEDNAAVQRALVIRRTFPKVRLITQLLLERNLHRLHGERCELVCVEQLKYAMLGRSVRVPALHTLLSGLLVAGSGKAGRDGSNGYDTISRSFTEELTKALDVDYVPERLMPKFSDLYETPRKWLRKLCASEEERARMASRSTRYIKGRDGTWAPLSVEEELAIGHGSSRATRARAARTAATSRRSSGAASRRPSRSCCRTTTSPTWRTT